jgi:sugar/nucleoside kinase (ribokinase family)
MQATRAVILVCDQGAITPKSFYDACLLVQSASDEIDVIGNVPNTVQQVADTQGFLKTSRFRFLGESNTDPLGSYQMLEDYPLEIDLLVVVIGNLAPLNRYISSRLELEAKQVLKWHVVSSNYARYALLEQQRSLSTYIPRDTATWVYEMYKKFGEKEILSSLDGIRSLRALALGETIIDQYVYCTALGKVSKDPLVAFEIGTQASQLGGILAVAKHLSGLGATTSVRSQIGRSDLDSIRDSIGPTIDTSDILEVNDQTLKKTRYVDRASNVRVFETYDVPKNRESPKIEKLIAGKPQELLERYDLVVVVDYGHGLIDENAISGLIDSGVFLAVNAQSNAGNRGFNPISRYKGSPMIFLNGSEVEIETRTRSKDLVSTVESLADSLDTEEFYVTNGSGGLICWQRGRKTISVPAFAPSVVDRTGAGDALLSITSLLRKSGVPREIAAFYGNIAGALLISSMGNETSLSYELVRQSAEEILRAVEE